LRGGMDVEGETEGGCVEENVDGRRRGIGVGIECDGDGRCGLDGTVGVCGHKRAVCVVEGWGCWRGGSGEGERDDDGGGDDGVGGFEIVDGGRDGGD
jgi:hypothetical protein